MKKLISKIKNKKHIKLLVGVILVILISGGVAGTVIGIESAKNSESTKTNAKSSENIKTEQTSDEKLTIPVLMKKLGFEEYGAEYINNNQTIVFGFSKETGKLKHFEREIDPKKPWQRYYYYGTDSLGDIQKLIANDYKILKNSKLWKEKNE